MWKSPIANSKACPFNDDNFTTMLLYFATVVPSRFSKPCWDKTTNKELARTDPTNRDLYETVLTKKRGNICSTEQEMVPDRKIAEKPSSCLWMWWYLCVLRQRLSQGTQHRHFSWFLMGAFYLPFAQMVQSARVRVVSLFSLECGTMMIFQKESS